MPSRVSIHFASILFILIAAVLGAACAGNPGSSKGVGPSGDVYYTRFAVQVDRGFCRSTNYRRSGGGFTLPINTRVVFESKRRNRFSMSVEEGGRDFVFEHVAKHTRNSSQEAFDSFFSPTPTDLASFSTKERKAIETGSIEIGMSRSAVLASAGPPPAVGTLSLDAQIWKYWSNRFVTFTVSFDDKGKVSSVGR